MIYTIVSKLPETGSTSTRNHFFAVDLGAYYYETEAEANAAKAQMDIDFPEWINEVVLLIRK